RRAGRPVARLPWPTSAPASLLDRSRWLSCARRRVRRSLVRRENAPNHARRPSPPCRSSWLERPPLSAPKHGGWRFVGESHHDVPGLTLESPGRFPWPSTSARGTRGPCRQSFQILTAPPDPPQVNR